MIKAHIRFEINHATPVSCKKQSNNQQNQNAQPPYLNRKQQDVIKQDVIKMNATFIIFGNVHIWSIENYQKYYGVP